MAKLEINPFTSDHSSKDNTVSRPKTKNLKVKYEQGQKLKAPKNYTVKTQNLELEDMHFQASQYFIFVRAFTAFRTSNFSSASYRRKKCIWFLIDACRRDTRKG
ncbi:hypothetical protein TNCV_3256211 [Trichonephila clavipes]|nr:hypothetical protein TNCV_3256211 [Trichonephila clavipes]